MLEQVSNFDQDIKFITGFAGSGKSTRIVKECDINTLVLTPTHNAARVLMQKGIKNVYTIHSVLKLVPTLNQNFRKGQRLQKLKQVGETKLDKIKKVIIDEFSMIPTHILDLLLEVLPATSSVLVVGDPYQLPPVDGEAINPLDYTEDIEELTVQYRAESPEIVETFMRFMNYIKYEDNSISLVLNPDIKRGSLDDYNIDRDRILAYTNNKVLELNNMIHKDDKSHKYIINGIDCIFNRDIGTARNIFPKCMAKGKLMEGDKLDDTINSTLNDIDKYHTNLSDYKIGTAEVNGCNYQIYYDENHYRTAKQLKKDVEHFQHLVTICHKLGKDIKLSKWCSENRSSKYVKERAQAWSKYIAHSNLVFDLRKPYASTVHKSQGQEFDTVYIAQDDIKKSIMNGYYVTYARLMYVALSRAINKVVIVN